MIRLPMTGAPLIGVDVSARWIGAVQLASTARVGSAFRIRAAACVARVGQGAPDASELARLADVLYRRGFRGSTVVVAAPEDRLITSSLELPPLSSGAPVLELAVAELARTHRRDVHSLECALWPVPVPEGQPEAGRYMAAALPRRDGETLLNAFEKAGLQVHAIDARGCALARACASRTPSGTGAVVELGEVSAVLVLVQSGVVAYQRTMPEAGVEALRSDLASTLGLSSEVLEFCLGASPDAELPEGAASLIEGYIETIAAEARAAFEYLARRAGGSGIDHLLLAGAGARIRGVPERLGAALGVQVETVSPAQVGTAPPEMGHICHDPRLTAALGLAAWEEGGSALCAA